MIISDAVAQKAFDYLAENAEPAAVARAQRLHLEDYTKTVLAQCMNESTEKSVSAQEWDARTHPAFAEHMEGLKEARRLDELYRWKRDQAHAILECWRTYNANLRGGLQRVG